MMHDTHSDRVRILIAEDEDYIRNRLARWLHREYNFEVVTVASAVEAVENLEQVGGNHYAVILLDHYYQTGPDGLDVLSEIKELHPNLPIILFTGKDLQIGIEALKRGAYSYLTKPISNEELGAAIQSLIRQEQGLYRLAETVRNLLDVPVCLVWVLDRVHRCYEIKAWSGQVTEAYRRSVSLPQDAPVIQRYLKKNRPLVLQDIHEPSGLYERAWEASQQGWTSLLSSPMIIDKQVVGIVDAYSIGAAREFSKGQLYLMQALADQAAQAVRHAEMYRQQQVLSEIGRQLTGSYELKAVLDLILERVLKLVGTDIGWLYLLNHETDELEISVWRGLEKDEVHSRWKVGEGVTGWVAQYGEAQLVPDVSKDKRFLFPTSRKEIQSQIVVPLKREDAVLGVLAAKSPYLDAFTGSDMAVLSTFATQAALAVERDKLARHVQQVSRLALSEDIDQLADYVAQAVHDLTGLSVALWLIDQGNHVLRIRAQRGLSEEYARLATTPLKGSITAKALEEKRPLWRRDIQTDEGEPRFAHVEEARHQKWRFFLCTPLLGRNGQALGSLSLYGPRAQDCSQSQQTLIWTFANQAAMALENMQLLKQERSLRSQAETLRQVYKTIGSADELKELTNTILDDLAGITDYRTASLQLVQGEYRTLLAGRGFDLETANRYLLRPISKDRLIRRVVQTKEPLILPLAREDPDWGDVSETPTVMSWIGVPLVDDHEVIGLLTADHNLPGYYHEALREPLKQLASRIAVDIRTARIFDSTQRRIRDLEIIHDAVEIISTKLGTDELLKTTVSQIAQRLECTHCTIFFPQRQDGQLWLEARETFGARSEVIKTRKFKPGEGLVGWVYQNGISVVLGDAKEDPRFAPARKEQERPRSMLVVPVKVGDQTIGVISADQDEYGWFGESERSLVETLAQQTGIAIQRCMALELFGKIGEQTIHAPNLGDILQQIVEGAINLTNTTAGVIYLLDEDGGSILQQFEHPREFEHPAPRLREGGITRQIYETGHEMVFPDIREEPRVNPAIYDHVRSMIGVPLKLDDHVIGVLFLNDKEKHRFTETEVSLLKTLAGQAAVAIQNRQFYDDLDVLNRIGTRLTGLLDEKEILSLVAQLAARAFNCTHCTVFRIEGNTLVVAASQGNRGQNLPEGRHFPLGEGVAGWVAQKGEPTFVVDTGADERFAPGWSDPLPDPASLIVVPIVADAGVYGVISAEHDRVGAFNEHDQDLLQALAFQAGQAVRNARLFKKLDDRIEDLRTLNRAGRLISSTLDVDRLLETLLEHVNNTLKCRNSTLFLLGPTGELVAQVRRDSIQGTVPPKELDRLRYAMGEGLAGWVAQERQSLSVANVDRDSRSTPGRTIQPGNPHSMLLAPMLLPGDKVVGVISADKEKLDGFDDNDKLLLETLAAQAAIAIENARLYRHIEQDLERTIVKLESTVQERERAIRELEVLTKIGRTVSNLGIDQILDLVYDEMGRIMDLRDAQVQFAFYDKARDEVTFPLAVEQDKERGGLVDLVRWGKRDVRYRQPGEDEIVTQLKPRQGREPPGLTEYVIRTNRPILIDEGFEQRAAELGIQVWPTFGRLNRPTHSWMGVPMSVQGRVIGIISIQSLEQECAFDADQVALLETISTQAAVAVENARLYQSLDDKVSQLQRIQGDIADKERALVLTSVAADFVHRMNNLAGTIPNWVALASRLLDPENERDKRVMNYLKRVTDDARFLLKEARRLRDPLPQPEAVNVADLISSILEQMELIASPDIKFVFKRGTDAELVWAVRLQLSDAVANILDNAAKAISGKGRVVVKIGDKVRRPGDLVRIEIRDTGCGIPVERLTQIFDLGTTYRTDTQGLGYGLWRAKNIIENLGGSISVKSQIGKGSTFSLYLPLMPSSDNAAEVHND